MAAASSANGSLPTDAADAPDHVFPLSIRWKNFRSFADTDWRTLQPLTIVIGPNNSGKTSLLAPLLLLQQTLDAEHASTALLSKGPLLDLGLYSDLVRNHDPSARVEFSLEWHNHGTARDADQPLGSDPPGAATMSFATADGESVRLHSLIVYDTYRRKMIERTLLPSGNYSLVGWSALAAEESSDSVEPSLGTRAHRLRIRRAIRESRPTHFFFDGSSPIFRSAIRRSEHPEDAGPRVLIVDPDEKSRLYAAIVDTVRYTLTDELRNITYIGPLRERAKRMYLLSGEMPRNVGTRGEYAPEILFRWRDDANRMKSVQEWLTRFGFSDPLVLTPQGAAAFSLSWGAQVKHASDTAFVDMGFGLSQVLPLIVQGVMAEPGSTIVAEQPEIHLNPRLQTLLADLFADFVRRGLRVVTETHSEHLLLTVRRLMAEKKLSDEGVALYFVERNERDSSVRSVALGSNGHIPSDSWPRGFFADALRESLALSEAQYQE